MRHSELSYFDKEFDMNARLVRRVIALCSIPFLLFSGSVLAHEDSGVRAEDDALNHLVAESMPAIYDVKVTGTAFDTKTGKKKRENILINTGTAFGVTSDGLALTKMHLVNAYFGSISSKLVDPNTMEYDDGKSIRVSITLRKQDGTTYRATIEGGDPNDTIDLVLLKIVALSEREYPYLVIADELPGYDRVVSIGSPYEFTFSVGEGVVSNPNTILNKGTNKERSYIQTTALTLPGSSGGPLLRLRDHRVVGMAHSMTTLVPRVGVGIGFATPALVLKEFLEQELRRRASN